MSQPAVAPASASQPGFSLLPDSTHLFTAANFVLIAVLGVLVVVGLIYGARLRRARKQAVRELVEHNEALRAEGVEEAPVAPTGGTLAAPVAPPPPPPAEHLSVDAPPMQAARLHPDPLDDEPIAAATPTMGENLAAEAAPPALALPGESFADGPVTQLKGLGPRLAAKLAEQGITTVGQLASLTDDEAQALDARLGPFTGRMARDRWQEQARFLAAGDRAGFEAVFGRL